MLIEKGANVDDVDEDRSTALLHAASKGHTSRKNTIEPLLRFC